jgi:hypothetical protein
MFAAAPLLLALAAQAGLMDAPDGAFQVRFDGSWYEVEPGHLALEADPQGCAVELIGAVPAGEGSLTMALRSWLEDKKVGAETTAETFTGLGGREGAAIHTTRMRKLQLQQLTWAALDLGDGRAALLVLRWDGSAQASARPAFYEIAGTALPPGLLVDAPLPDLEALYRRKLAPPDERVELRGLFYEGGALRGELFNGAERVLNRAVLEVQVRQPDGRATAARLVEVVPGADRRALGPGRTQPFHIDLSEGGAAPAGLGGARVQTLEWAPEVREDPAR